jgi:ribonuclease BN (tRNA processing enzyme)
MKLTILGSGTVVPDSSRNSAGYFLELSDARLMLDCGAGTLHALARYCLPWEQMTHLFVSHFHVDHVGELASLFFAFRYGMKSERNEPLTIVGPRGIDRVMDGLERAFGQNLLEQRFRVDLKVVEPGHSYELDSGSRLTFFKTPHTDESLAVSIQSGGRSICYTGDTGYSDELVGFFRGADVLISECSFLEPREGVRHLCVREVSRLAARAMVARLIVTHFYFDVNETELKAELQRGYSGDVIIGRDGLVVVLE